jgi:hypothetical protein
LADLNPEKYAKVKELLSKSGSDGKLNIDIKHVQEIGDGEKKILLRRF